MRKDIVKTVNAYFFHRISRIMYIFVGVLSFGWMSGKHEKESHGESLLDPPGADQVSTSDTTLVYSAQLLGSTGATGTDGSRWGLWRWRAFDRWNIFGESRGVESNHQASISKGIIGIIPRDLCRWNSHHWLEHLCLWWWHHIPNHTICPFLRDDLDTVSLGCAASQAWGCHSKSTPPTYGMWKPKVKWATSCKFHALCIKC